MIDGEYSRPKGEPRRQPWGVAAPQIQFFYGDYIIWLVAAVLRIITMSVGAFKLPPEKGDPDRGDNMPEVELMEKLDIVLSTLFTTNRKAPVGSAATPNGCWPVAAVAVAVKDALLILKVETVPAATFVTNRNLSIGSTVMRNGLLWHEELPHELGLGPGSDEELSVPFPPIWKDTTDSSM